MKEDEITFDLEYRFFVNLDTSTNVYKVTHIERNTRTTFNARLFRTKHQNLFLKYGYMELVARNFHIDTYEVFITNMDNYCIMNDHFGITFKKSIRNYKLDRILEC